MAAKVKYTKFKSKAWLSVPITSELKKVPSLNGHCLQRTKITNPKHML